MTAQRGDSDRRPLNRIKAFWAVLAVVLALIALLSIYAWGHRAFDALLTAGFIWCVIDRIRANDRDEDTRADVDDLGRSVDAIVAHLTGSETPGAGRHADGQPATYRPSPRPSPRPTSSPETNPMSTVRPDLGSRSAA